MIGAGLVRRLIHRAPEVTNDTPCTCGHRRGEHIYVTQHFQAVCVHARKGGACVCSKFEAAA